MYEYKYYIEDVRRTTKQIISFVNIKAYKAYVFNDNYTVKITRKIIIVTIEKHKSPAEHLIYFILKLKQPPKMQ